MKNLKFLWIAFVGLIINFNLQAQKNKSASHTLLWEVSGKGLKKPSYIFGTYHFAGKDFIDTMKVLSSKLAAADAVVGELVIDDQVAMKLMPYMMMKGNTLDKLLTPTEYKLVDDYVKQFPGYELKLFNTMKPVVVQTVILQLTAPKTFTKDNPELDQYIQDYGKANGKKLLGLETAEDQAKILFGDNVERQKEQLLKGIKEADKNKKMGIDLYNYYVAQDLEQLEKLFNDTDGFTQAEMDDLLKNRNQKWLAQLPTLMQNQSLFVAIGAGHLLGKDGLITGLKAMGYTVKPVATN